MSQRRLFGLKPVQRAAFATIEQLERRRLLTSCTQASANEYRVYGDDSVDNVITVYWDSVNSRFYVKEGTTQVCVDPNSNNTVSVYGGASTNLTSTGADLITIDSSVPSSKNGTIFGGDGDDTIYGGAGVDSIEGGQGNNYLSGRGSNDTLEAGSGNDTLYGGDGDDSLYGDGGHNVLSGEGAMIFSSVGPSSMDPLTETPCTAAAEMTP